MTVGTKEHYEMMAAFEKILGYSPKKESQDQHAKGHIYCNGEINTQFKMFSAGYSFGRAVYM